MNKTKEILYSISVVLFLIFSGMFLMNSIIVTKIDSHNMRADFANLANRVAAEALPASVTISSMYGIGSGVIFYEEKTSIEFYGEVSYYYVLTNHHVIDNSIEDKLVSIETANNTKFQGEIIGYDADKDLAIVYFVSRQSKFKVAKLANSLPSIGEVLILIGNPKGQKNTVTFGNFKNITILNNGDIALAHNTPGSPGMSGGGVFNTNLEIVGIHYRGMRGYNRSGEMIDSDYNDGFAIPVETVKKFLKEIKFENVFEGKLPSERKQKEFEFLPIEIQ
jgi:S1-C subfamily serine protease